MDNIEIKKNLTRRNMESLLQESAIDNSYNHEVQELRQAYTKTIKDLHSRIKELEKNMGKLELEIKQKDEIIMEQYQQIGRTEGKIGQATAGRDEMGKINAAMRKRLQHLEYKLQTIENNRREVLQRHEQEDQDQNNEKVLEKSIEQAKKQMYMEVRQILQAKIGRFVKEMKQQAMSHQVEHTIETFLEDILYINPGEPKYKNGLFETERHVASLKQRQIGKISGRSDQREKLSELDEWKLMEKSLEKLKSVSPMSKISKNKESNKVKNGISPYKPLINYI